jgi:hypothetical protein
MSEKPSQDPAPGATGGAGPGSPNLGRPAPQDALPIKKEGWGSKTVFLDFGRSKIFAVTDDSDEVLVFNNLVELAESLRPAVIVLDNLPEKLQSMAAELAKTGITFMRLKDLSKISEERKKNGLSKSNENDVILLKTLYRRDPESFQTLCMMPEELLVRELSELWAVHKLMRKTSKQKVTTTHHPAVIEAYKELRKLTDELSKEIHKKALELPLYKQAFERLGLKGPTLAYIISHDELALKTFSRDKLLRRYHLLPPYRRWDRKSRVLLMLARSTILNKHNRYYDVYLRYVEKFKDRPRKHWKATFRVARRIILDLKRLTRENEKRTLDT